MQQIQYVMQFSGFAVPAEDAMGILRAATTAPNCTITTIAGPRGVRSSVEPSSVGSATFESEVCFTGESTFQETGIVRFGDGAHQFHFSTVGVGHLGSSADPTLKHGAVIWQIDGGEGQFEGATGLITSNFTVGESGEVTDNHFGVIFLK